MIGYAKHFLRGRQAYAVGASVLRQKSHLLKLTHNGKLFFIVQFAYAPFFCSFEQPLTVALWQKAAYHLNSAESVDSH